MPLDPDTANNAIRSVVQHLMGLPLGSVRPANQSAPTGHVDQPFATVLITDFTPVGQDSRTIRDDGVADQLTEVIQGTRQVICDLQMFRAGAYAKLSRLDALLRTDVANMMLQEKGLSFIKCSSARNLSEVVDTYYEERAQVIVEFYIASSETLTIPTFSTVVINIQTEEQTVSREVNLDVNP